MTEGPWGSWRTELLPDVESPLERPTTVIGTLLPAGLDGLQAADDEVYGTVPVPGTTEGVDRLLFAPGKDRMVGLASEWLRPEAGIVERQPRQEVDDLLAWLQQSDRGPVLRLLCGPGGQGKTHVAEQVCAALRDEGWLAGFAALPPANWRLAAAEEPDTEETLAWLDQRLRRAPELVAGIRGAIELQTPTLLVVDQAEHAGPLVGELLGTIAEYEAQQWVRVLLLARTPDGWFSDLAHTHRLRSWVAPTPTWLSGLPEQLGDPISVWRGAVAAFARRAVEDGVLTAVDLSRLTSPPPAGRWETTLDLYADAALRVLDTTAPSVRRDIRRDGGEADPVAGVLAYERRQVSAVLSAAGCAIDDDQRDWALAVVSLRAVAGPEDAAFALASVPEPYRVPFDRRADVAAALERLYQGSDGPVWAPPRPDRLADAHLLDLAARATDRDWWTMLGTICGGLGSMQALHAARTLIRCLSAPTHSARQLDAQQRISDSLSRLLRAEPDRYAVPLTLIDPQRFDDEITDLLATGGFPAQTAHDLDELVLSVGFTPSRASIAAAASERLVAAAQGGDTPEQLTEYARCLNNLGIRLAALGMPDEALEPAEEAVAVRRALAAHDSAMYLPDLALSLDILGTSFAEAGYPDRAVGPAEEAVAVYRRLVGTDPAQYAADLAAALNTLGLRLVAVGAPDEGVTPLEEAVAIYRRLAAADRANYLADLAYALTQLGVALAEAGRWDDSLEPAEEAVADYRKLTVVNAAVYLPDLALALNSLGNGLAGGGRTDDALDPAEEAVAVYRRLVAVNSTAYLPNLAASLNNLGIRLAESGRREEALTPVEEAVEVYRRLATQYPVYQHDLALSLNNLANRLVGLARAQEALTPVEEAVAIRRDLSHSDPTGNLPDLARSLAAAGQTLIAAGHAPDAVEVAAEAVGLLVPAQEAEPDAYGPLLLAALGVHADAIQARDSLPPAPPPTLPAPAPRRGGPAPPPRRRLRALPDR